MNLEPVHPGLEFVAQFRIGIGAADDLGHTPWGRRRTIPFTGGSFAGPRLSGEVLDGGDWQVVRGDGVAEIDTRATLRTADGALVHHTTTGVRLGPADVMARLAAGEPVDPAEYHFRMACRFETAAPQYTWLNGVLAVASALRHGGEVVYDAYAVV